MASLLVVSLSAGLATLLTRAIQVYWAGAQHGSTPWLFAICLTTCLASYALWSAVHRRVRDPLKNIPAIKFPDWRTALKARLVHVDPSVLLETAQKVQARDFLRFTGIGGADTLLLISPEARRECFSSQAYSAWEKPWNRRKQLLLLTGKGLLFAEGDEHKFQRRGLQPAFSAQHVRGLAPMMWEKASELVNQLTKHTESDQHGQIDIYDWASKASLDIIGVASWGFDFQALRDPDGDTVSKYRNMMKPPASLLEALPMLLLPPKMATVLPGRRSKQLHDGRRQIFQAARIAVSERRDKEAQGKDILSVAMRSKVFDDDKLVETLLTFLAAGHETSATAAMFTCLQLALHLDIQNRLREEIRTHLPSPSSGKAVTWQDLESLPLLKAVSLEALRLNPPVATVVREATHDTAVCGQFIPKGTQVINHLWFSNRFGWDRPDEFVPERWMGADSTKLQAGSTGEFDFSPFNHGNRACIGQSFARLEQLAMLAGLVGRFEMRTDLEAMPSVVAGITAIPDVPIRLRMNPVEGW